MTKQYFTHTPQSVSQKNQAENLAIEVERGFLNVEKDLWNEGNVNTASIGSSIGTVDPWYLRNYASNKTLITNYEQDLYFPSKSKEASLDLIPSMDIKDLNTVVIKNKVDPSQVYTYKHDGVLEANNDFCFVGRKLVVGKTPANSKTLSIAYNGYEPIDSLDQGLDLKFNILQVKVEDKILKTFKVETVGTTHRVVGYDFKGMCSEHIVKVIDNTPYDLDKYVSISDEDSLETYNISDIQITNSYIAFQSEDSIPEYIKIYVANSNISRLIEGLYRLFYAHDHGKDGGRLVNHSALTGLFTTTDKLDYSVTDKENYDHPQYFNREGFIDDPTVFNNALVGDVLVSSKNSSNAYNNLSSDSFKLIFGEYASGHRLGYNKTTDSLVIDSLSRDGIKVVTPKNKKVLDLNDHTFSDQVDGEFSGLRLSIAPTEVGLDDIAVFSIKRLVDGENGVTHEDSAELHVYSTTFSLTKIKGDLNLVDGAKLSLGDNKRVVGTVEDSGLVFLDLSPDEDQSITLKLPLYAKHIISDEIDAKKINITSDQKLVFGEGSLNYENDTVRIDITKPLTFVRNGYGSGVVLGNGRVFASNQQGTHTTNQSERLDMFIESTGGVYLLKGPVPYSTGSTNLHNVERADLYAAKATTNLVDINYSETAQNGIRFNGDTHTLFAQRDLQGNTSLQMKSTGGLNVVTNYTVGVSGSPTITYGSVRASEFRSEGSSESAGFYGNIIVPVGKTLTVNGNTAINSDLTLNKNLTVNGVSTLNSLDTKVVTANTVTVNDGLITSLITAPLGYESRIYFGSESVFNNSVDFKQVCTFSSNCSFNGVVTANTVSTKFLYVTSDVDFSKVSARNCSVDDLQFETMLQTNPNVQSEFSGPLILKSGARLDRDSTLQIGSSDIISTRNTAGLLLTENSIKMGNNSTIKTSKVFANKGLPTGGNSDITGGFAFETNLGVSDGDTGLFSTDKGNASTSDDLVFMINGVKVGELSATAATSTSVAGREKQLVTLDMLSSTTNGMLGQVLNMVYPIGTIYSNAVDNRDPKLVLNWPNSVWARCAVGMTLVGAEGSGSGDKMPSMWNKPSKLSLAIESEFGEFEHRLTEEEMAGHWHGFPGDDMLGRGFGAELYKEVRGYDADSSLNKNLDGSGWYKTTSSGGDKPHNNVQPSLVVARWRRVG